MKTILIVDDNEANRLLIRDILSLEGYEIIELFNGRQAVSFASRFQPDLILMDIQLPVMDGITATRKLKENPVTQHIPIIAISGYTQKCDKDAFLAAGGQAFLCKPIHIDELEKNIASFLKEKYVRS